MSFKEARELAMGAGLRVLSPVREAPVAAPSASTRRPFGSLGAVVDELLRSRRVFDRRHPKLQGYRPGTVTEHLRQRVLLGEAQVTRPGKTTNRKHQCPTRWKGSGKWGGGGVE